MEQKQFYDKMKKIVIPITIQSFLQAMLSLIDQIMIGSLGSAGIAGVGMGSKFISLYTVTMSALVTVAGIFIAQYKGKKDINGIRKSFYANLYIIMIIAIVFILISVAIPQKIMGLYSDEQQTIEQAAIYLKIMSIGFIPQAVTLMLSAVLRNLEAAKYVMYASGLSVVSNTVLNYLLIFGIGIFPQMDVAGAALATCIARILELLVVLMAYLKIKKKEEISLKILYSFQVEFVRKIFKTLAPILLCEFLWSLGENVYAMIYGHIATDAFAAMTLTYPIQTLAIGLLTGVAAASGIIVGESLGADKRDDAYNDSKRIIKITVVLSIIIGVVVALIAGIYVRIYNVSDEVRTLTVYILYAYAIVFSGKVINMVLGGGILRSGGQTKYIMVIDIVGTWLIGVPVGLFTGYVLEWPIYYVYFAISLEEFVRMLLEIYVFKSKKWMKNIAN